MFFFTVSIGTLPAYKHAFVSMCPKKKIIENKIRNKNKMKLANKTFYLVVMSLQS